MTGKKAVRFEVFAVVMLKIKVFCVVSLCCWVNISKCFEGLLYLPFHGQEFVRRWRWWLWRWSHCDP